MLLQVGEAGRGAGVPGAHRPCHHVPRLHMALSVERHGCIGGLRSRLASGHVPDPDGAVLSAADGGAAIRCQGHREHRSRVAGKLPDAAAAAGVIDPQEAVVAARGRQLAVGAERDGSDHLASRLDLAAAAPALHIPQPQQSVAARGERHRGLRSDRECPHLARCPFH